VPDRLLSLNPDFVETAPVGTTDVRVELPVDYRGDVSYRTGRYSVTVEGGHGFGGTSFHGGIERQSERMDVRGGLRYALQRWNPTGGVGFNLTPRVSVDVAAFGTSANIEGTRRLALAASIRIRQTQRR
jgi:hypothetical protein